MHIPLHINYHRAWDPRPEARAYDRQNQALIDTAQKLSKFVNVALTKALREAGCGELEIPTYIGLEPFSQVIDDSYMNFWFMVQGEYMVRSKDHIMRVWSDEVIALIELYKICSHYTNHKRISLEMRGESGLALGLTFIPL